MHISVITRLVFLFILTSIAVTNAFQIVSDFPGGNIAVEKISNDTVYVKPDLRDTEGNWFYWNFKVRGARNQHITFNFTETDVITSMGPAFSRDLGTTWQWFGEENVVGDTFTYHFNNSDSLVWFCMAIPYTESNLNAFLQKLSHSPFLHQETLCTTRSGRAVEKLMITNPDNEPAHRVLLTARHHACETTANYVMEGIISSVLLDKDTQWLRDQVEFMIVPFMDKDGVENGDQGKNRVPHDHNRDYAGKSLYKTTEAIRNEVPTWSDGKLHVLLDIHCPWIKYEGNEHIFIVGTSDQDNAKNQVRFSELIEQQHNGELPFYANQFLPFGTLWNTDKNYNKGLSSTRWGTQQNDIVLSASMEFPYAIVHDQAVTIENARQFGKSVAHALQTYLHELNENN